MADANYRQLYRTAETLRYKDPPTAIRLLRQASALAKEHGDFHEALFMDHWLLQTYLSVTEDYEQALDLAVQTTVEARKPMYATQTERICVHEDLIKTYLGIDPIGQAKFIEDAMAYMEKEANPSVPCYYCMMSVRASFELNFGATEKAEAAIQRYYAESEPYSPHYFGLAHTKQCELFYLRGEWEKIIPYAERGIKVIGANEFLQTDIAILWAMQALAHRRLGRESEAMLAFQRALNKAGRLNIPLGRVYYDVMCDFHLAHGELAAALALRERQLTDVIGKGQPYWESVIRLSYAWILKQLGRTYDEQSALIRHLATKLKKPEIVLNPLATLEAEA